MVSGSVVQQGRVICTQWPMVDFFTINTHYRNMPSYLPSAFFIETKQTNWDLEVPDLHHEKPLRDSCRIWIKKGLKNWKGILCALYTSKELTGPWWLFFASTSNPGYSLHKFRLKDFFPDNFQKFLHGQRIKKAIQENTFL